MILCDTGPLVAAHDRGDQHHVVCQQTLASLSSELLITTWACLTEAMHLLGRSGGHHHQDKLWEWFARNRIKVEAAPPTEWQRLRTLMATYGSVRMDMADASLVVAAEQTGLRMIFSFDSDFSIYLINDRDPFTVVP